jgi:hypothetical protein
MGYEGYPPPGTPGPPVGIDRAAAAAKVNPPAIALMIVAGLAIMGQLLSIVMNMVGAAMPFGMPGGSHEADRIMSMMSGTLGVVIGFLMLIVYGVVVYGAIKMRQLQNFALALTASIMVMLPCSCCCVLGLPVGIWALVVLNDANVKQSFV